MVAKALFSSNSDNWSTPQDLYDKLNAEFHFTLDPCASDENHKCDKYFTESDDGLSKDWEGSVFVNPPYSQIKKWIKKGYEEAQKSYCQRVVMLIPSRTDCKVWHEYVSNASSIRFLKGRLKFGDSKNSAPFPSAVIVFRNNEEEGFYDFWNPNRVRFWDWKNG